MSRVHVVKHTNSALKCGYRIRYNRVPQSEGRWTVDDLRKEKQLNFSFNEKITHDQRCAILDRWSDKVYGYCEVNNG